jgi:hypothetical protein
MDPEATEQLISEALAGHRPNPAVRQRLEARSGQAFARAQAVRRAYRLAGVICVVTLLAGVAFIAGRHCPGARPSEPAVAGGDTVVVSRDMVTWLEAGRFFARLGMPDREARAYQQASRLAALCERPRRGRGCAGTPVTSRGESDHGRDIWRYRQ